MGLRVTGLRVTGLRTIGLIAIALIVVGCAPMPDPTPTLRAPAPETPVATRPALDARILLKMAPAQAIKVADASKLGM